MLEVKCPYRRAIIHGTIPKQYYAQVQINMLICGLPRADFVEYRPPPNFQLNIVRVVPDKAWLRAALPRIQHFHASLSVLPTPDDASRAARDETSSAKRRSRDQ